MRTKDDLKVYRWKVHGYLSVEGFDEDGAQIEVENILHKIEKDHAITTWMEETPETCEPAYF